jgi:hypothetical protein
MVSGKDVNHGEHQRVRHCDDCTLVAEPRMEVLIPMLQDRVLFVGACPSAFLLGRTIHVPDTVG